jgi:hypothetical protein
MSLPDAFKRLGEFDDDSTPLGSDLLYLYNLQEETIRLDTIKTYILSPKYHTALVKSKNNISRYWTTIVRNDLYSQLFTATAVHEATLYLIKCYLACIELDIIDIARKPHEPYDILRCIAKRWQCALNCFPPETRIKQENRIVQRYRLYHEIIHGKSTKEKQKRQRTIMMIAM